MFDLLCSCGTWGRKVDKFSSLAVAMQGASGAPKQRHSIAGPHPAVDSGRRRPSFLNLHIPETNWRGSLSQLHLPTFTLTTPEGDQPRKFTFGLAIRRHSHNVS
jgi:hypothetical protein